MKDLYWPVVLSGFLIGLGVVVGSVGVVLELWAFLAFAGILELAGIGWAVIATREEG